MIITLIVVQAIFGLICFSWGRSLGLDEGDVKGWNRCYIENFEKQQQSMKGAANDLTRLR
jgi:hypothetical protein